MIKNHLTKWHPGKLRIVLLAFFFSLAIPTAVLILHAYSQLKWESFHHHRLQADELVKRINKRFTNLIDKENARSFTDYTYLNITDNQNQVQQSPLARLPVNQNIPGAIGYFQIDDQGRFSTPLLPVEKTSFMKNVSAKNRIARSSIHNRLFSILRENKLVEKEETQITRADDEVRSSKPASALKPGLQLDASEPVTRQALSPQTAGQVLADDRITPSESQEAIAHKADVAEGSITSQSAFDSLQTSKLLSPSTPDSYSKSLGRVEDIKLKRKYAEEEKRKKETVTQSIRIEQEKRLRKEQNILPAPAVNETQTGKAPSNLKVNMFESEIDTFELSLLNSGHFVLFRKVWRDNQRYTQGLLIDSDKFINGIVRTDFLDSRVSNASNLTIAFQGNILSTISSKSFNRYYSSANELQGTLLLQSRLSSPMEQLELIFSVNQLPDGPGAQVINWLAVILFILLSGGFYLLYRLALRQITLARQQQDFVSAVSHELKTPLTSIRMYGEMLREGWTTEEKRKEYYDYIYEESERLTRLINNVLQLARMTRNELKSELSPISLSQLIDTLRSKVSTLAERAGFALNIQCDETILESKIEADIDHFTQVIINLVDNAIKFSAKAEQKQIDIQCRQVKDNVILSIRDYGPGIQKDQMRKIFELFYRSENELTRETVGTGIGLSLVNQLVSAMHGSIDIINREPGVEFQLSFPFK